ncbi:DUF6412 domain-containing protein [Microbacterium sp. NPDC056003]|jgi:hypothetical protein|uniref:DUF6412 domain-containing protein n=1 Tax=Microbacterium sp. NPDC056003 TaxID=3345676 RepID=UPI0035D65155
MFESLGILLRLLLEVFGAVAVREPSALVLAAALAAIAIVALTAVPVELPASAVGSSPHPRRAIDVSVRPAQSDPDAPGHSRPRAPGFAAPAA